VLTPGTLVGHYEILEPLGAGGMGEVYRARDRKLGREVALKVLPDEVAADASRLMRLQREATLLAALNHPHIAQLHGVDDTGPRVALVMEFVDGEDLARRLARGAIPFGEALHIASEVALALEAAHEVGIVHRDLKPANIKVRPDGVVKVLDFGLAKGPDHSGSEASVDGSPTLTASGATRPGAVLGTAGYMAPEQAMGRPVDRRADIWAFGCLLYELLSGRPGFRASTAAETVARVMEREPDWQQLPSSTPAGVVRVIKRCLQKDPGRRLRDIGDARFELEDASREAAASKTAASQSRRAWLIAAAAAVALAIAVGVFLGRVSVPAALAPAEMRITRLTDFIGLEQTPALSPDGRAVAFTAAVGNARQIYVQLLAGGNPLQLTRDAADHQSPRWSPDSSEITYFSPAAPGHVQGTLWEVSALGGVPRRVTDSLGGGDVSGADGRLAFFRLSEHAIALVAASADGSVTTVAEFPPSTYYLNPRWSPDAQWIAFTRGDSIRFDVFAVPASGGPIRQLTHENNMISGFAWLPDSRGIVYSSSHGSTMPYLATASLWAVGLDGTTRQVTAGDASYVNPDVARDGRIIAERLQMQSDLWTFPVDGTPQENASRAVRLTRQTGHVLTPTASPDGREVAFLSDSGGHANVWVIDTSTGERRQITHERDPAVAVGVPIWSPDGTSIAFVSSRGNRGLTFGVWLVSPDGSNLRTAANPGLGPGWSHDGAWLYYSTRGDAAGSDVALQKVPAAGGAPVTVTNERLRNVIGSDGTTLYYVFERPLVDGTPEFEIRAANPESGPFRVLTRISPSRVPIWQIVNPALSPDGRWLAQALTDGLTTNIWRVSAATGEWRQLTDFGGRPTFIARRVSWSADGRSVLAAVGEGDADIVLLSGLLEVGRK